MDKDSPLLGSLAGLRPSITPFNVFIGGVSLLLCFFIYQYFLSPLAGLPGPLQARLGLDTWLMTRSVTFDVGPKLRQLHDQHACTFGTLPCSALSESLSNSRAWSLELLAIKSR